MAKVLGESARYTSQEAVNQHVRLMLHCLIMVAIGSAIEGVCFANLLPVALVPRWVGVIAIPTVAVVSLLILTKWGIKRIRVLEKSRAAMRRGAAGEMLVGSILSNFPDDYFVINDLTTPFGNLDHVVIGPTGVFVLDAKNCRGVIASDGNGGLLHNGRTPAKDHVRPLIKRMMDIHDKVRVLATGPDPFYQAVLVFTAAWVDAKWGSTGAAHCIREDQLYDYVVERKVDRLLRKDEVKQIAQAFLGLAHVDQDFSRVTNQQDGVGLRKKTPLTRNYGGASIVEANEPTHRSL